jgi:hypothetical protein
MQITDAELKLIDENIETIREFGLGLQLREPEEMWFANLITAILNAMLREYNHLKIGLRKETGLLAWACRNLLELYIFTRYVLISEENARRFIGDRLVDGIQIFESFKTWHLIIDTEADTSPEEQTVRLAREQLLVEGMTEEKFLATRKLAKLVGLEDEYAHFNKVCSKLVHPTAWSVLAMRDEGELANMRPILFMTGARYASDIGYRIKEHVSKHGERPAPTDNTPVAR